MIDSLQRAAWLAAYQFSLVVAILMLPVALLARQGGFTLPVGRLVERTGNAYATARDGR